MKETSDVWICVRPFFVTFVCLSSGNLEKDHNKLDNLGNYMLILKFIEVCSHLLIFQELFTLLSPHSSPEWNERIIASAFIYDSFESWNSLALSDLIILGINVFAKSPTDKLPIFMLQFPLKFQFPVKLIWKNKINFRGKSVNILSRVERFLVSWP